MKYLLSLLLTINPITYISQINSAQKQAQAAFNQNQYKTAISKYQYLINELKVDNPQVFLNLAHACFQIKSYNEASAYYKQILQSRSTTSQSVALNQLGLIQYEEENLSEALELFKQAIKKDPQNYKARYNYELTLKKLNQPSNKPNQSPQNNSQRPNSSPRPSENTLNNPNANSPNNQEAQDKQKDPNGNDQTGQLDEENPPNAQNQLKPKKLEAIKLNRERAEAILETMRNQEIQYIQQMQRRKKKRSSSSKNERDW